MADRSKSETWEELFVGTVLLLAVAWFVAKAAQHAIAGGGQQPLATAANSAQAFGTPYFWSGSFGGSNVAGLPVNAYLPGGPIGAGASNEGATGWTGGPTWGTSTQPRAGSFAAYQASTQANGAAPTTTGAFNQTGPIPSSVAVFPLSQAAQSSTFQPAGSQANDNGSLWGSVLANVGGVLVPTNS